MNLINICAWLTVNWKFDRSSSIDHWLFFTKQGADLAGNKSLNLKLISQELSIQTLDFSYESLGKIDTALEQYSYGRAWETLYDALVYYVGEIIISRVDGYWKNSKNYPGKYPYVSVADTRLCYMPVNIVWQEIDSVNPCNIRKATADEIKKHAMFHPKNNPGWEKYARKT